MSELPKKITVNLSSLPQLSALQNPVVINDSPFSSAIVSRMFSGNPASDDVYRLVFKKGSSRELMTIRSGELMGLSTSIAIEHGKISSHVGLSKVEKKEWLGLLPTLLNLSYLGALRSEIKILSGVVAEIRNQQILEEQARFERITDAVIECCDAIPNIALDNYLRSSYLIKIFGNYEDCQEIFYVQRERFKAHEASELSPLTVGHTFWWDENGVRIHPDQFFEFQLLNNPIFSVFERMVACKVCEMLIVGDYSEDAVNRYSKSLLKPILQLRTVLERRLEAFDRFSELCENGQIENHNFPAVTAEQLNAHRNFVKRIRDKITSLLEDKLKSFDIVRQLSSKENIELLWAEGVLVLNAGTK
jgi:hypothetical protein